MSYGEAPVNKRLPKLLALLAGSFAVGLVILGLWFWFFTSIPLPDEAIVLAVVPSSVELPSQAPEEWKKTAAVNSPLPTVVGFAGLKSKVGPFAVKVFSLNDLFESDSISVWKLGSDQKL